MQLIIGIGEYAVSNGGINTLKTYALASCVAVTAYSPIKKAGAMIHVALPEPATFEDSFSRPGYYATTGVPLMIEKFCMKYGCLKGELQIQIFGGADSVSDKDVFHIGKRNIEAVIETLDNLNLRILNAHIGGRVSRTIEMNLGSGEVLISTQPIAI